MAVLPSHIGVVSISRAVHILEPTHCFLHLSNEVQHTLSTMACFSVTHGPTSHIKADTGICTDFAAPLTIQRNLHQLGSLLGDLKVS